MHRILTHYFLGNLYRSLDENAVVPDVVSLLDFLVRDKLGVSESQGALVHGVAIGARLLEVFPIGVRVEGFGDVLRFGQGWVALVQDRESHLVREGPLQEVVVLSWKHPDVHGKVGSLAAAVPVQECRNLELVAVAVGVKRRAEELVVAPHLGLLEFSGIVVEFPDEDTVVAHGQLLHLPPQFQDLLPLPPHQVTHHGQVRLSGVLQVSADRQLRAPMFAPSVFKRAQDQSAAAVVLDVVGQILSGDVRGAALVWTLHWEPRAVILVILDCVVDELFSAVLAGLCAFGTLGHAVLGQETPHHPRPAFVLTVNALLGTHALMVLVCLAGELAATKLALDFAFGTVVLQVVGQVAPRQLHGAAVRTRDDVERTGGEVAL